MSVEEIEAIQNEEEKWRTLNNRELTRELSSYEIETILKNASDALKKKALSTNSFISMYGLEAYEITEIILSMEEEERIRILSNKIMLELKLHLYQLTVLIKSLSNDQIKLNLARAYKINSFDIADIITTFSLQGKIEQLLTNKELESTGIKWILVSLDIQQLMQFIVEHKEILVQRGIEPYMIVPRLSIEGQRTFLKNLETMGLDMAQKRKILVVLDEGIKEEIDVSNLPEEYKTAISIKNQGLEIIKVDFTRNLEAYRGLDSLIEIDIAEIPKEMCHELFEICPDLKVMDSVNQKLPYFSIAREYQQAEEWVASVLDNIPPEYSKLQKMAVIDNAIGRKISYSPDFDTENFNSNDNRAIWRVISRGYGVCSAIAEIECYMFKMAGIDCERVDSEEHAFVKAKNIEMTNESGETITGNTILDPTWNLVLHRYGAMPNNFCISYEEAREGDMDDEKNDQESHKNDEKLADATLSLGKKALRNLFQSVGLTKEDGRFPVVDLIEKSEVLNAIYANNKMQNAESQLKLLAVTYPEFATCQNESIRILSDILLDQKNLDFERCAINRVYKRGAEAKTPYFYVYMDFGDLGNNFYVADKQQKTFEKLTREEFERQFECYDMDLERTSGVRPWENIDTGRETEDLAKSSDKIIASEEGR